MILPQSVPIKINPDPADYTSILNYVPFRQRDSHFSTKSNPCIRNYFVFKSPFQEHKKTKKNNSNIKSKQKFITFYCDQKIKQMPQCQNTPHQSSDANSAVNSQQKKIKQLLNQINTQIKGNSSNVTNQHQQIQQPQKTIQSVQQTCKQVEQQEKVMVEDQNQQQIYYDDSKLDQQKLLLLEKQIEAILQPQNDKKVQQQQNNEESSQNNEEIPQSNGQLPQKTIIVYTQAKQNKENQTKKEIGFDQSITISPNPEGIQTNQMKSSIVKQNVEAQISSQKPKSELSVKKNSMKSACKAYKALFCTPNLRKINGTRKQSSSCKLLMRFGKKSSQNE